MLLWGGTEASLSPARKKLPEISLGKCSNLDVCLLLLFFDCTSNVTTATPPPHPPSKDREREREEEEDEEEEED